MVDLGMVDIDKVGGHTRYWGCCKLAVRGGFSQSRKVAKSLSWVCACGMRSRRNVAHWANAATRRCPVPKPPKPPLPKPPQILRANKAFASSRVGFESRGC